LDSSDNHLQAEKAKNDGESVDNDEEFTYDASSIPVCPNRIGSLIRDKEYLDRISDGEISKLNFFM